MDDLDKAEYWYKEALSAKEDHIPAHLTMAKLASRHGKAHEAEAWFSKAMKIDPTEGSIYQHYGELSDRPTTKKLNYQFSAPLLEEMTDTPTQWKLY